MSTEPEINIGDYVQALASAQFFDNIDFFIERERLNTYTGEPCNIIMNGWYMHNPSNWPPTNKINPLFVAFHINSETKDALLSKESITYLKQFEPIGCRDYRTRDILIDKGVDAYFSGCMTLTLGKDYTSKVKDGKCYFVDLPIPGPLSFDNRIYCILKGIKDYKKVKALYKKNAFKVHSNPSKLGSIKVLLNYYNLYSRVFTYDTLLNAEYITQVIPNRNNYTNDSLFENAKKLIQKYSSASLVVTSRIHCALPCLGIDSKVIFINNTNQEETSSCRMGGLLDLFNYINCNGKDGLHNPSFKLNGRISINNSPENKKDYLKLAKQLSNKCINFVSKTN